MQNKNNPGVATNNARGEAGVFLKTTPLNTPFTRMKGFQKQFYNQGEPTPELLAYVADFRLDLRTVLAHVGLLAVCLCIYAVDGDGRVTFRFDPNGIPSAVIEVLGANGATVIDLVAWPLHSFSDFATAVGDADVAGAWFMLSRGGAPLRVYRTPHDWLAGGCNGCVILNPDGGGHWLDRAGGPFVAEDIEHGREIRTMLGYHAPRHTILVPSAARRIA